MPAYIHADIEVTDPAVYDSYSQQVPAVLAAHGGRFLVRGGAAELLEGARTLRRQVILEFPDMAQLQAFYHSPEYQALVKLRQSASKGSLIALPGA
jgi:uncharacterized protein (DUF1330 family)